jgi:hypothetical protein
MKDNPANTLYAIKGSEPDPLPENIKAENKWIVKMLL